MDISRSSSGYGTPFHWLPGRQELPDLGKQVHFRFSVPTQPRLRDFLRTSKTEQHRLSPLGNKSSWSVTEMQYARFLSVFWLAHQVEKGPNSHLFHLQCVHDMTVNYRNISDIHSGVGRAELCFCRIIQLIKKAVHSAVTWEQQANIPPKPLHSTFKLQTPISTHALPPRLDSTRRTDQEQDWWNAALGTVRKARLAFLFPVPVFSTGVVTQGLGSGCGCRLPCCKQTDKQRLLAFAVKVVFLLFCNTAYLAVFPDDTWLTPVHSKSTEWTVFVNSIIAKMVTNDSGLAGNSTVKKGRSPERLMSSNRNLWF